MGRGEEEILGEKKGKQRKRRKEEREERECREGEKERRKEGHF